MMERRARELHRVAGYWFWACLALWGISFAWDLITGWRNPVRSWMLWAAWLCLIFWAHMNGRAYGIREALKSGEGRASLPPERKD